ncbi:unnamed protein product [Boreogadus saida]
MLFNGEKARQLKCLTSGTQQPLWLHGATLSNLSRVQQEEKEKEKEKEEEEQPDREKSVFHLLLVYLSVPQEREPATCPAAVALTEVFLEELQPGEPGCTLHTTQGTGEGGRTTEEMKEKDT